jgi:flagellar FliJ protein
MINDLEPLKALLAQTERERDQAMAQHRRAQAAHEAAQAQAEQLVVYRREYEQRWSAQFQRGGEIEVMRCYQGYTERLTQAVEAQARAVDQAVAQIERAATALRDHEIRCASVRRLLERRMQDLRVDIERREQRTIDELAARAATYRTSMHPHAA